MLQTGWFTQVFVKSEESHRIKALLLARDQLVKMKRRLFGEVRGILRPFGIRLPARAGTKRFDEEARAVCRKDDLLYGCIHALLEALGAIEVSAEDGEAGSRRQPNRSQKRPVWVEDIVDHRLVPPHRRGRFRPGPT